ncbi:MAG: arginine--tRNA ligase [Clostridia bacterium]|nr:arginine--tRNA ligase [Clostridia bacterium]
MTELKRKIAAAIWAMTDGVQSQEDIATLLEYPPDSTMGDLALPCFKFAKAMRKSPMMIAASLAEGFSCEGVKEARAIGGYLNFTIDESFYCAIVNKIVREGDRYGRSDEGKGKTVVLDYSSPNVAKPFHIGHLGTTVIGHALKKLHEFVGYTCVGINHLGDWGTQFGKIICAYRRWGSREAVEAGGVDELVNIYVKFHEEAEKDPTLNDEARAEFHKLELGDEENIALWKWFIAISLAEYKKTYDQLGIEFDSYNGEAFYTDKMPEQIALMREKGILTLDDGATIVNLDAYNMPPCLILKRDGSTLYPTRDIAAAVYRKRTYDFDKCIYVTSSGQSLHFAQWFKVVDLMGYDWADKLVHVPYGTISIGGEKLATRTGNVILLRDLFAAAIEKCLDVINEKNPTLDNKEETAEAVGVGAIVFYYLLNGRIKDSDFNMDDALSFDGNTGPYTQYTYARCSSILGKVGETDKEAVQYTEPSEYALCKVLSRFPEAVKAAIRDYEPSVITRYSLEVATAFNKFYQDCRIISADGEVNVNRVLLVKATRTVIREALSLICLKTPEKI